jgi:hypothetical protein
MNRRDRDATTLLMAHVEYWENALLPEVLGEALTAGQRGSEAAGQG